MGKLEKKVALITGGGSGIGKATAKKFADEGALVVVQDFNEASAEEVAASLTGVGHFALSGDVSNEQDMGKCFFGGQEKMRNARCLSKQCWYIW